MRPFPAVLLLSLVLEACGAPAPQFERNGLLQPGSTIAIETSDGDIQAYAPERGSAEYTYDVAAYGDAAKRVLWSSSGLLLHVTAGEPGVRFLIRAPRGTTLNLTAGRGNISVADYDGIVNASTKRGDIKMLIPQYGNASIGKGALSVVFASDSWPGTLHFTVADGTAEIYVNEHARARLRLHTGDGTVFSDFPITGTSSGRSETIDAPINGGGPRAIDVEVKRGDVRVLQLKPQI